MSEQARVVIFTPTNARILKVSSAEVYRPLHNCVINPEMAQIRHLMRAGIPPHYWKLNEDREVVEMTKEEKVERDALIASAGVDNHVYHVDHDGDGHAPVDDVGVNKMHTLISDNRYLRGVNQTLQKELDATASALAIEKKNIKTIEKLIVKEVPIEVTNHIRVPAEFTLKDILPHLLGALMSGFTIASLLHLFIK